MQTDTSPIEGAAAYPRLGFLIRRFHLAVQRQRQHDAATLASVVRALRRGGQDAEQLCRLINIQASCPKGQSDEVSR